MNVSHNRKAALFVLALFFAWGIISWYWYTCSIKGFCGTQETAQEEQLPETTLPIVDEQKVEAPIFDKLPVAKTCTPYLSHNVIVKGPNRKTDVIKVQSFLNRYVYARTVLPVNGVYGPRTIAAVKQFQSMHAAEILAPYRLRYPTGNVTARTRDVMNAIVCNGSAIDKLY